LNNVCLAVVSRLGTDRLEGLRGRVR
jgi:hypothetical protein